MLARDIMICVCYTLATRLALAAYGTKLVELLTYYGRGATRPRARLSLLKACAATERLNISIDRRTEETGMEI